MEKGFTGGRGEAKGCWAASQSGVRPIWTGGGGRSADLVEISMSSKERMSETTVRQSEKRGVREDFYFFFSFEKQKWLDWQFVSRDGLRGFVWERHLEKVSVIEILRGILHPQASRLSVPEERGQKKEEEKPRSTPPSRPALLDDGETFACNSKPSLIFPSQSCRL